MRKQNCRIKQTNRWLMERKRLVICYRCLHVYDINSVKLSRNKKHPEVLEKKCPKCRCTVYFS
ncbi:hypothetical protein [Morganella morganii]|uniref:hypothetical protein n=1 Tax=Morganella morganii TaxID=582 RepID=UPI000CE29994|nr:hypothetical protein C4E49_06115 [Morganella morganii]